MKYWMIAREDFDDLRVANWATCCSVVWCLRADGAGRSRFDFNDICAAISDKLERRHPHVFGASFPRIIAKKKFAGEQIKTEERQSAKAQHSALDDIPRSLPGLDARAKIQKTLLKRGF